MKMNRTEAEIRQGLIELANEYYTNFGVKIDCVNFNWARFSRPHPAQEVTSIEIGCAAHAR